MKPMNFGQALDQLFHSEELAKSSSLITNSPIPIYGIRRSEWPKDAYVCIKRPDDHSDMTESYLFMAASFEFKEKFIRTTPWQPTQGDLFATTWMVALCDIKDEDEEE